MSFTLFKSNDSSLNSFFFNLNVPVVSISLIILMKTGRAYFGKLFSTCSENAVQLKLSASSRLNAAIPARPSHPGTATP